MRILIFHGYLLRGTGSNVYNAAWRGRWRGSATRCTCSARTARRRARLGRREPGPGRVVGPQPRHRARPAGLRAGRLRGLRRDQPMTGPERRRARPLPRRQRRGRARRGRPLRLDVALANHLVMGPVILARALGGRRAVRGQGPRQRARVHGAAEPRALPAVRPRGARAAPAACWSARATRRRACGRSSRGRALADGPDPARAAGRRHEHVPAASRGEAAEALHGLGRPPRAAPRRPPGAARRAPPRRCAPSTRREDEIVSYVGKLIVSKGVDLLLAAWPLIVTRAGAGRAADRRRLRRLPRRARAAAWRRSAAATSTTLREIAGAGPRARGRPRGRADLPGGVPRRARAGSGATTTSGGRRWRRTRVAFTGRLEHDDLPDLLRRLQAQVVPSTFPEAFGMVAAEAAACGALPLSAAHSGLAEVARTFAPARDEPAAAAHVRARARARRGDRRPSSCRWLALDPDERERARRRWRAGWPTSATRGRASPRGDRRSRGELADRPRPPVPPSEPF